MAPAHRLLGTHPEVLLRQLLSGVHPPAVVVALQAAGARRQGLGAKVTAVASTAPAAMMPRVAGLAEDHEEEEAGRAPEAERGPWENFMAEWLAAVWTRSLGLLADARWPDNPASFNAK